MLPVSFLSGALFTLVGAALRQSCPSAATTTGILTFANTTGAALGALVGGFVLLPFLGMEKSLLLLAITYGAIALLMFERRAASPRVLYPAVGAHLLSIVLFPAGAMADRHITNAVSRWSGDAGWQVVGYREGITETILYVEESMFDRHQYYRLVTNSLSMSSTRFNARRYMKLYVYLPVAIHANSRKALLISYGVGSTAKALTETDTFEQIDVVDISRDILEMSSIVFPNPSQNPLFDKRVNVFIEDGRYFLKTTHDTYDLITGEPPPPQIATVVNLYTQEYFQLVRERLNEGGIVTYWLPLHSLSDKSAKAIIKAFVNVFPHASLWHGWREDVMLVGMRGSPENPGTTEWFERQWKQSHMVAEMKNIGIEVPEQLGALFIGGSVYLDELTHDVRPLVDDFPKRINADSILGQGRSRLFLELRDTDGARERFAHSSWIRELWPDEMIERTVPYFDVQRTVDELIDLAGYPLDKDLTALHNIISETSLTAPALWFMGGNPEIQNLLGDLSPEERALPAWKYQLAAMLFSERRYLEAAQVLAQLENETGFFAVARIFRIYALCLASDLDAARLLAEQARTDLAAQPASGRWLNFFWESFGI